jgi:multiple sugar transport system permease protein
MGFASAMAWLLFGIIMVITAVQVIVSKRFVYYEGEQR